MDRAKLVELHEAQKTVRLLEIELGLNEPKIPLAWNDFLELVRHVQAEFKTADDFAKYQFQGTSCGTIGCRDDSILCPCQLSYLAYPYKAAILRYLAGDTEFKL